MHLSFAIIYSRSITTSASTTAASFRCHINIISVTFAALHVRNSYVSILHILSRIMVGVRTLSLHVLHVVQTSTDGKKGHIATSNDQLF